MTIDLVHGVFNPTSIVFEATMKRLIEKGYDLDQFTWIGPQVCPFEYTDDPEVVIVLDVTLTTLQETVDFAWKWAAEGQERGGWRLKGLMAAPDRLRLLYNAEPFQSFTLRWRRIKIDANVNARLREVRNPRTSPGVALIFVAAEHPERVTATDYKKRFGWFIPGIECTVSAFEPWWSVSCIRFRRGSRRVGLHAYRCDDGSGGLAIPIFQE